MPERTVKGHRFLIVIGEQRITIKHVSCKGKTVPRHHSSGGAHIEVDEPKSNDPRDDSSIHPMADA